jgi:Ca-activated chloride channel family protein
LLNWAYPDFIPAALVLALALLLLGWHWRRSGRLARLLGSRARHRGWKTILRMAAGAPAKTCGYS